ncbi:uncharacterized protein LOC133473909 [Phyllopteryx taeniolatus]|uniref:uncharacterized protein LOC133473909 n=1 Tax=Phyllopteryx taeniolatus TaxID=161469 RepID=UPI002AD51420|nr:uncharacterized protein LOC133473909 [Phyllopteryx taeniolatus]
MGVGNEDNESDHEETTTAKRKRTYTKNNKWAEKLTRKVELGWIREGKQIRKRKGWGTRTLGVSKESKKADMLQYAKDIFFPNGKSRFGRCEAFSCDILDYQEEAVLDEDITIGDLYKVRRMGVLQFYLCTNRLVDSVAESSDANIDLQLRDTHEDDLQTIVIQSADLKELDAHVISDTSEVMIGPFLGEPMASQLDDSLIHQPILQFEVDELAIPSVTPTALSTATFNTPDTAYTGDQASDSTALYALECVITIKFHRVHLLEEMISQFKDAALLKHHLKYTYIDEKGADADGVSRGVYAAFWTEFMDHTAEGEDVRVPTLSPRWCPHPFLNFGYGITSDDLGGATSLKIFVLRGRSQSPLTLKEMEDEVVHQIKEEEKLEPTPIEKEDAEEHPHSKHEVEEDITKFLSTGVPLKTKDESQSQAYRMTV